MSRFYEALKQASRSLHLGQESAEIETSDLAGILQGSEIADLPPLTEVPEPPETLATVETFEQPKPSDLQADEVLRDSSERPATPEAVPQDGALGVPTEAVLDSKARLIPNSVEPMLLEHYRLLRTKIMQEQSEKPFRSLLVTSAEPKEGKTVTVLNLALTFGMLPSYKVLVIDGDIRKGHMSKWLGVDDRSGLGNLLEGSAKLDEVVLKSGEVPFYFMSRGNSKVSPPELLHSARRSEHIRKMSRYFDLVLVDSPPISLVADPELLAGSCEAILLVARAFYTSRDALKKLSQEFKQFRVIGTVLNGGPSKPGYRRYRSYYPKA